MGTCMNSQLFYHGICLRFHKGSCCTRLCSPHRNRRQTPADTDSHGHRSLKAWQSRRVIDNIHNRILGLLETCFPTLSMQTAPFRHGLLSHSLISSSQFEPTKPATHSQLYSLTWSKQLPCIRTATDNIVSISHDKLATHVQMKQDLVETWFALAFVDINLAVVSPVSGRTFARVAVY